MPIIIISVRFVITMKRKVNRVGKNTLTVSLPSPWAKSVSLNAGDVVSVEEDDATLRIVPTVRHSRSKVVLDVTGLNYYVINRFVQVCFLNGVEQITLKFSDRLVFHPKKNREVDLVKELKKHSARYIGLEIISQTNNSITMQSFMKAEQGTLESLERRILFLIKDVLNEFIENFDDHESFHEMVYDHHDNIVKFLYYYVRLMNNSAIPAGKKRSKYRLYFSIDKLIDKIRHASDQLVTVKKPSAKLKRYVKMVFDMFIEQIELFRKGDLDSLNEFILVRYSLLKKINNEKFTNDELRVLCEVKPMLDITNEFYADFFSQNLDKYLVD